MGTLVPLVGALIAVAAYTFPRQASPEPAPPPEPRAGSIRIVAGEHTTYYPKNGSLPVTAPPQYPASQRAEHCDDWYGWSKSEDLAPITSTFDILVEANVTSPINISDIAIRPVTRTPQIGTDAILCQYFAGGEMGTSIRYDLENPTGRVPMDVDDDGQDDTTLPGGTFEVGTSEAETLTLILSGAPGQVYGLVFQITYSENGARETLEVGSEEDPVLFATYDDSGFSTRSVDWNFVTSEWEDAQFGAPEQLGGN